VVRCGQTNRRCSNVVPICVRRSQIEDERCRQAHLLRHRRPPLSHRVAANKPSAPARRGARRSALACVRELRRLRPNPSGQGDAMAEDGEPIREPSNSRSSCAPLARSRGCRCSILAHRAGVGYLWSAARFLRLSQNQAPSYWPAREHRLVVFPCGRLRPLVAGLIELS
jgi:hypothetical protein